MKGVRDIRRFNGLPVFEASRVDSIGFSLIGKKESLRSELTFFPITPSTFGHIQSTLVISTSIISNNRLYRRENLVLVFTQKSKIRLQNIVEKRINCSWGAISALLHNIFNIYF